MFGVSELPEMVIATESDQPGDVLLVYGEEENAGEDEFNSPRDEERKY